MTTGEKILKMRKAREQHMSDAQKESVRQENVKRKLLQIYAVWSALALFAMKFMSSVSPKSYVSRKMLESGEIITSQYVFTGLLGFVMYYNLEWFLILALIGIAVGVVLIWQGSPALREKMQNLWNRIKAWRQGK